VVGVTGQIRYYSNAAPVNAAAVQLQTMSPGAANLTAAVQTDFSGQFAFMDLTGGNFEIAPQKTGDVGDAISSLDAAYALQAAVGLRSLTPEQQLACDVTGNGTVSSFDAQLILQYKVGLIGSLPVASLCGFDWAFMPVPVTISNQDLIPPQVSLSSCETGAIVFQPLDSFADHQDFSALVFGDCTGNWQPSSAGAAALRVGSGGAYQARLGRHTRRGRSVLVPVNVEAANDFHALDAQLSYDQTRLKLQSVRRVRRARGALLQVNSHVPGTLAVALASSSRLQSGTVLVLQFGVNDTQRALPRIRIQAANVEE